MVSLATHVPGFTFRRLRPQHVGKAVDCISASFEQVDPFSKALSLTKKDWAAMSGLFVERASTHDPLLSVVAIDDASDDVVGVILNEDWKTPFPQAYKELGPRWRPVRAIFNRLQNRYRDANPVHVEPYTILHSLYFTCVHPDHRRKGIVTELLRRSVDMARDNNYQTLLAETSSDYVGKVVESLGFRERANVEYNHFLFEGENIFHQLTEYDKAVNRLSLYSRHIDSGLLI